jgi:hypothetical protein
MDPYSIGYLSHNQGLESGWPMEKKLLLPGNNLISDFKKGLLPLLETAHEKTGTPDLLPEVEEKFLILSTSGEQILVLVVDLKTWELLIIETYEKAPDALSVGYHDQIRDHSLLVGFGERTSRFRLQGGYQPSGRRHILDRNPQLLRDFLIAMACKLLKMMPKDPGGEAVPLPPSGKL